LDKCFELFQNEFSEKITSKEVKCDANFLKIAKKPYDKISDFNKYESRFLKCLSILDKNCLRGLISKKLQLSFGVDGLQDRRDIVFTTWKKKDFVRLHNLVKKGSVVEGNSRRFPPQVAQKGIGFRGEFKKENGGWLLTSFLSGD
jgi:hypothetical protein